MTLSFLAGGDPMIMKTNMHAAASSHAVDARRLHQTRSGLVLFPMSGPFITQRRLKQYLEPFKDPDHLPHIKNLRIGTRALTFWPQRFTTDPDADSLIELLRDVKEIGGRHIAIMSHLSHYRELSTKKVQDAIHRLKQVPRRRLDL